MIPAGGLSVAMEREYQRTEERVDAIRAVARNAITSDEEKSRRVSRTCRLVDPIRAKFARLRGGGGGGGVKEREIERRGRDHKIEDRISHARARERERARKPSIQSSRTRIGNDVSVDRVER